MEQLRHSREPAALVLVIIAGIRLLAGIVAVPVLAAADAYGSFATAAMFEAGRSFDLVLTLATAGVAASCLLAPATPRARPLATVALIETVAATLVSLGYGLMGLFSSSSGRAIEFAYLLLGLALPVLAALGLLSLLRTVPVVQAAPPAPAPQLPPQPAPQLAPPPPPVPAAWQPEQATGRVWHTAGDAARGTPGADWPSGSGGWQPIPGGAPARRDPEPPPQS